MRVTRIGGPTVLVELDGWRILIDPTFDAPGRRYSFGAGTSSVKMRGPALTPGEIGSIDLVLLSHDHHADNLDDAGRALLPGAGQVLTTVGGARRLPATNTRGLRTGQTVDVEAPGRPRLHVTATACRHGPPLSRPIAGAVIGFAIRRAKDPRVALWVTGDTVRHGALRRTARRLEVDVAIINAGGVRFPLTGGLTYSMTGADLIRLVTELSPRVALPAHYDGWSHFLDGEEGLLTALADAPTATRNRVHLLPAGQPVEM